MDEIVKLKILKNLGEISDKIANGHGFSNHIHEFKQLRIFTKKDYKLKIEEIIRKSVGTGNMKVGARGRYAFWDDKDKIIVIYDPNHKDLGTAFIPKRGKQYFLDFK